MLNLKSFSLIKRHCPCVLLVYVQVQLIPFMFVAGDHAKNDINGEMRETLEARGYTVSTLLEGLGQQSAIQELFLNHIRFALHHKLIDISEKKKEYAAGKDVH